MEVNNYKIKNGLKTKPIAFPFLVKVFIVFPLKYCPGELLFEIL